MRARVGRVDRDVAWMIDLRCELFGAFEASLHRLHDPNTLRCHVGEPESQIAPGQVPGVAARPRVVARRCRSTCRPSPWTVRLVATLVAFDASTATAAGDDPPVAEPNEFRRRNRAPSLAHQPLERTAIGFAAGRLGPLESSCESPKRTTEL